MRIETKNELSLHFFVCCNERENKDDCASKGGKEIRDDLKKWTQEQGLAPFVRINQAGCLGRCAEGPVAVAYPSGGAGGSEWFLDFAHDDIHTFKRKIEEWVVGAVLSETQLKQFESGTLVTIEPYSRVKHIAKNRFARIGTPLPITGEDGKFLFKATLSQAEVIQYGEIPPIVLEILGYSEGDAQNGNGSEKFKKDYRSFWQTYFAEEQLTDQTQLWVCVWRK